MYTDIASRWNRRLEEVAAAKWRRSEWRLGHGKQTKGKREGKGVRKGKGKGQGKGRGRAHRDKPGAEGHGEL
jgi:hypothetical protein